MFNNICDIKSMNRRPKNVGQSTVCPGSEQWTFITMVGGAWG
jgi:hypothetical protein